jgi:hypothetical protein
MASRTNAIRRAAICPIAQLGFLLTLIPSLSSALDFPPDLAWVQQVGSTNTDAALGVCAGPLANFYVCGWFSGNVSFDTNDLQSAGAMDCFTAKYSSHGALNWVKTEGTASPGQEGAVGICLDAATNCFMTGGINSKVGSSTWVQNMYLAKYSPLGQRLWHRQTSGGADDMALGSGVGVDSSGNCYVGGHFVGNVTIGTTNLTTGVYNYNVFLAKYSSGGNLLWVRQAGGTNDSFCHAVAVDAVGNTYLAGDFSGAADFGFTNLTSMGTRDAFLAKYDANGNFQWVRQGGGTTNSTTGYSLALGSAGLYLAGEFAGSASFNGTSVHSAGGRDPFVAKYSSNGDVAWVARAGGTSNDYSGGVSVDSTGNPCLVGTFVGAADFGTISLTSTGGVGTFVSKLNPAGNFLWATKIADGSALPQAMAIDQFDNITTVGYFTTTTAFGATNLTSAGHVDIFIARLVPPVYPNLALSNQMPHIDVTGPPGTSVRLECTPSLSGTNQWISLVTNIVPYSWIDVAVTNFSQRLYRTVRTP